MTDLATAMANPLGKLPDYLGVPVVRTAIAIRNTGDGLSQAMAIDPVVYPPGTRLTVVLDCVVHGHDHDRILDKGDDTGTMLLTQVLKAGTAVIVDRDLVADVLDAQAERIQLAKEAAAGVQRLPMGDAPADPEPDPEGDADVRPFAPPGSARNPFTDEAQA